MVKLHNEIFHTVKRLKFAFKDTKSKFSLRCLYRPLKKGLIPALEGEGLIPAYHCYCERKTIQHNNAHKFMFYDRLYFCFCFHEKDYESSSNRRLGLVLSFVDKLARKKQANTNGQNLASRYSANPVIKVVFSESRVLRMSPSVFKGQIHSNLLIDEKFR